MRKDRTLPVRQVPGVLQPFKSAKSEGFSESLPGMATRAPKSHLPPNSRRRHFVIPSISKGQRTIRSVRCSVLTARCTHRTGPRNHHHHGAGTCRDTVTWSRLPHHDRILRVGTSGRASTSYCLLHRPRSRGRAFRSASIASRRPRSAH
ncbi:hypothetical protein C8Q80DRAFT_1188451 [Daedaleopsis nitida]|nr:hypothetical protein C8Q80DRAFT_1188451 [Daedaleopsis nitida]